jgi:hypothetical protein
MKISTTSFNDEVFLDILVWNLETVYIYDNHTLRYP